MTLRAREVVHRVVVSSGADHNVLAVFGHAFRLQTVDPAHDKASARRPRRCSRLGDDHADDRGARRGNSRGRPTRPARYAAIGTRPSLRIGLTVQAPSAQRDRGSAVVDFCMVMVILVPLVLGILQVGLVLHVRNTLTSAASEAARQAATVDGSPDAAELRAQNLIAGTVGAEYATAIEAVPSGVDGYPGVEVRIEAAVPALGLFGPNVHLSVEGHAVAEQPS